MYVIMNVCVCMHVQVQITNPPNLWDYPSWSCKTIRLVSHKCQLRPADKRNFSKKNSVCSSTIIFYDIKMLLYLHTHQYSWHIRKCIVDYNVGLVSQLGLGNVSYNAEPSTIHTTVYMSKEWHFLYNSTRRKECGSIHQSHLVQLAPWLTYRKQAKHTWDVRDKLRNVQSSYQFAHGNAYALETWTFLCKYF